MIGRACVAALLVAGFASSQTEAGLDVVFLLDVSRSMIQPQRTVTSGARLATYELSPGDRVAVMRFSSGIKTYLHLSSDTKEIVRAFHKASGTVIELEGKLHVHDALFAAVEEFPEAADPGRRRAIVLVTNDSDRGSARGAQEVIAEAVRRQAAVSAVLVTLPYPIRRRPVGLPIPLPTEAPYPDVEAAASQLQPIAASTGGDVRIRSLSGYLLRQLISHAKGSAP